MPSPWRTRPRTLCGWQCYAGSVLPSGPPVALSHLCSRCPFPFCLSLPCSTVISYAGQGHFVSPKEKAWAPRTGTLPTALWPFQSSLWQVGGSVYIFLIYFLIKRKRSTRYCCGDSVGSTGAGSFQEPEGSDVQRSRQIPLRPEPREAQPRNTGQCAGPAGCWEVERNLAPVISA